MERRNSSNYTGRKDDARLQDVIPPVSSGYEVTLDSADLSPSDLLSVTRSLNTLINSPSTKKLTNEERRKCYNLMRILLLNSEGKYDVKTVGKVVKIYNLPNGPRTPVPVLVGNFQKVRTGGIAMGGA